MKLLVDKSFVRDSKKLPPQAQKQLKEIITKLLSSASWQEINAAKMEGAKMPTAFVSGIIGLVFI